MTIKEYCNLIGQENFGLKLVYPLQKVTTSFLANSEKASWQIKRRKDEQKDGQTQICKTLPATAGGPKKL